MPLYEYECSACAHRFEVIQKYTDAPIDVCPKCGGAVNKLFSSPAIQFKGSGFYLTDYGRGGKSDIGTETAKAAKESSGSGSSTGEAKATESKAETKADAKTETKAETKAETKPATKPTT
jgi:putative FmdB family regulatory protein